MLSKMKRYAQILQRFPAGYWIMSRLVRLFIPYTGSLGANIQELSLGSAVVTLPDRRSVRNHLSSIHAIALANLGEMTAGMAMMTLCPEGGRFIVTRLEIDYLKKARGELTCRCDVPQDLPWETVERTAASSEILDLEGDAVAKVTVYFKLGVKR